jgi:hypothetical protein
LSPAFSRAGSKASSIFGSSSSRYANKLRVLWTGGDEALDAATKFAIEHNGITLEMTRTGKLLTALTKLTDFKYTQKYWERASFKFADEAEELVHVIWHAGRATPKTIFSRIELTTVIKNGVDAIYHVIL